MHSLFLSALKLPKTNTLPSWMVELARMIPELLMILLDQSQAQSLERLQLVSLAVSIADGASQHHMPKLRHVTQTRFGTNHEFLRVFGEHDLDDGRVMHVTVTYYVRGQRKFYRPEPCAQGAGVTSELGFVSREQVKEFFESLERPNTFFYAKELAELNGRPDVVVPSQMILLLMLASCYAEFKTRVENFCATFHRAIMVNHPLSIVIDRDHVSLMSESNLVASLVFESGRAK